jgi:excisionase family DNA binding protein
LHCTIAPKKYEKEVGGKMVKVFNKKEAAKALNISVETLNRYKKAGKLPFHQIGDRVVFTENDLLTFLETCAVPATACRAELDRKKLEKKAEKVSNF